MKKSDLPAGTIYKLNYNRFAEVVQVDALCAVPFKPDATIGRMEKTILDTSVRPQDDFFGYVNNDWLNKNPIPPSESVWGTFHALREESWLALHEIVNDLLNKSPAELNYNQALLNRFFGCALNFDSYEDNHMRSLGAELDIIAAINSIEDLVAYVGKSQRSNTPLFWNVYVDIDDKNSQLHVLRLYQSGLGLPNRDYYLDESDRMKQVRHEYKRYFKAANKLVGADISWEAVWDIERNLAKNSWTDIKLRDVQKNYNRHTIATLTKTYNNIPWDSYFKGLGWDNPSDNLVIGQPSYFDYVESLFKEKTLDELKAYVSWRTVSSMMSWISQRSTDLHHDFFGRVLGGATEIKPLWKRAVLLADRLIIGEALGREYATRHFPESSKQAVLSIVEDIRAAFHARIDRLDWMLPNTKSRAHTKLDNMKVLIGYPSIWKDLSGLEFTADNHIENINRAHAFDSDKELAKIGNAPAAEQWEMNAHTVNAYHHPNRLEIVFPAAILQPPFYDSGASLATNLGGIGAVIGHELTHGFDDQGSEFDESGNTNPWQTPVERKKFNDLAKFIVDQANKFETVPGTFLQGKLILGEAIADVGGLELAVEALRIKGSPEDTDLSDSIRQLFINAARCECGHATTERLVELAKTDPHPPSRFRVNCIFGHVDAFYDAFDIKPGDALYIPPNQRSKIW